MILCAASIYEKKYYLDPQFEGLPEQVKNELQAACVLFVEEVSGIIVLQFDQEGNLFLSTEAKDSDGFYDEIGAGLRIKQLQKDKAELFEQLELYYKVFILGDIEAAKDLMIEEEPEESEEPEAEDMPETENDSASGSGYRIEPELELKSADILENMEYDDELDALLKALGMGGLFDYEDDLGEEY